MKSDTTESHAYTELAKPDTNNATYIGWADWEYDGNSDWPTDFHPLNKKDFYELLDRMNQGLNNGYRSNRPYQTYRMNQALVATLSDKLGMPPSQRKRAIEWFTGLDLQDLGLRAEIVAFSVCAYTVHSDETDRECHPNTKEEEANDLFIQIQDDLGISQRQFEKCYGKVAHRIRKGQLQKRKFDKYQLDDSVQFQWRTSGGDKGEGWL